jgi:hypothetical protein
MRNFKVFFRKNWLVIVLFIGVLFLLFRNEKKTNDQEVVVPAEDIGAMVQSQQKAASVPSGTVTFCFRLDGRKNMHLPALMGNEAQSIYPNGLSGFNWSLLPTATGEEDYGVLEDGTIFVKEDFLLKWGMTSHVEIKCDLSGWKAEQMERVDLGGEIAYIYQ